jgi:hypothetical protein
MDNINLNVGGLIGALALGAVAAAAVFTTMDAAKGNLGPKLIIGAVIVGAIAGNFIWGAIFKKSK